MRKNIIFFVDAQKKASGGGKKIYDYSNYINSLKEFSSEIIHIKKKKITKWKQSFSKFLKIKNKNYSGWKFNEIQVLKNYSFTWFNQKINIKNNLEFNNEKDLIVLPEIFAHFGVELAKQKIEYVIFLQNPYAIFSTNDFKTLEAAYEGSKLVLYYSREMKKGILKAFPKIKNKLFKTQTSFDSKKLKFNKKLNTITYMPRKLPMHSVLVLNYLRNRLPKKWKFDPIENLNEEQTFIKLKKSKMFLSFSFLEGLGMPPLEAAIAGNKVIGYTGEGGKEYWRKPIFTEIHNGDIFRFCDEVIKNLEDKNFLKKSKNQRNKIIKMYLKKNEENTINKFLNKSLKNK